MPMARLGSATLAVLLLSAAAASAKPATGFPFGTWENEKRSVRIKVAPCGANACGKVIWANAEAKADAAEGGTKQLVGTQLFQNFAKAEGGEWKGKIFVPDLNGTYDGSARPDGASRLVAEGCAVGGLVCKKQVWTKKGR